MAIPNPDNQYKYLQDRMSVAKSTGNAGLEKWVNSELKTGGYPAIPTPPSTPAPTTQTKAPNSPSVPSTYSGVPTPPQSAPAYQPSAEFQEWNTKQNELFSQLQNLMNQKFEYDPNSDPGYQAQRDLAKLRAGDATRDALEIQNEKGLLSSSLTNSQLGQIQQRAEQEAAAYIPQYREQAYGRYQDQLANAANLLGLASGRANTAYDRNYTQGRDAQSDAFNEAQLTGVYRSPQAQQQIDALLDLKRQAEAPGITREARAALSQQADGIRASLSSMGVDISNLGANTHSSKANAAAGVQTLAGKEQQYNQMADQRNFEFQKAQQEWENVFNQAQFDESKAARIWEQAFKEKSFAQSVKDAAASRGLQWASLAQRDKEFIADQAWKQKEFDYMQQQDALKNQGVGRTAEDYYKAIDDSMYLSPEMAPGAFPGADPTKTGRTTVNDPDGLESYIYSLNLPDEETYKLLARYNLIRR